MGPLKDVPPEWRDGRTKKFCGGGNTRAIFTRTDLFRLKKGGLQKNRTRPWKGSGGPSWNVLEKRGGTSRILRGEAQQTSGGPKRGGLAGVEFYNGGEGISAFCPRGGRKKKALEDTHTPYKGECI